MTELLSEALPRLKVRLAGLFWAARSRGSSRTN